jgi:hypothetical protein
MGVGEEEKKGPPLLPGGSWALSSETLLFRGNSETDFNLFRGNLEIGTFLKVNPQI